MNGRAVDRRGWEKEGRREGMTYRENIGFIVAVF